MAPVVERREGEGYFAAARRAQFEAFGGLLGFAPAPATGTVLGAPAGAERRSAGSYFEAANKAQREAVGALFGLSPPLPPVQFYSAPTTADGGVAASGASDAGSAPAAGGKALSASADGRTPTLFGLRPDAFEAAPPASAGGVSAGAATRGSAELEASLSKARADRDNIVRKDYFAAARQAQLDAVGSLLGLRPPAPPAYFMQPPGSARAPASALTPSGATVQGGAAADNSTGVTEGRPASSSTPRACSKGEPGCIQTDRHAAKASGAEYMLPWLLPSGVSEQKASSQLVRALKGLGAQSVRTEGLADGQRVVASFAAGPLGLATITDELEFVLVRVPLRAPTSSRAYLCARLPLRARASTRALRACLCVSSSRCIQRAERRLSRIDPLHCAGRSVARARRSVPPPLLPHFPLPLRPRRLLATARGSSAYEARCAEDSVCC